MRHVLFDSGGLCPIASSTTVCATVTTGGNSHVNWRIEKSISRSGILYSQVLSFLAQQQFMIFCPILGHHFSDDLTCEYFLIIFLVKVSIILSTFPY
jgi:hypothetical protein